MGLQAKAMERLKHMKEIILTEEANLIGEVKLSEEFKSAGRNKMLKILTRSLIVFLATLFMACLAVIGVIYILLRGPSSTAQELFTRSVKETSAIGFIPDLFLSRERIDEIMSYQGANIETADVNTSLVVVSASKKQINSNGAGTDSAVCEPADIAAADDDGNGIEIVGITGASYRGMMMIIKDPSRLFVGTGSLGSHGQTLEGMVAKYGAAGGVNGGGFDDPGGSGNGGVPTGIVIADGKLVWGNAATMAHVAGFDADGILQVGYMSGQDALDKKIQWACCYGPTLIVNGEPLSDEGITTSGVNPRTAIGQRADGAVLLLVVDGRQVTSLGATLEDVISIMLEHGAVNASNLDGGSSSQMIYNDETLNINSSVRGARPLPTSILVRK